MDRQENAKRKDDKDDFDNSNTEPKVLDKEIYTSFTGLKKIPKK